MTVTELVQFINGTSSSKRWKYILDIFESEAMKHQEYKLSKSLLLYVPPVLLVMGLVGNLLSFVVLMMPSMRRMSIYRYLAALSVTDTLVLSFGLPAMLMKALDSSYVWHSIDWMCRAEHVLTYTFSDYSVWLIIAVTVDRYVAVCHPLHAASFCNRGRAVKVGIVGPIVVHKYDAYVFFHFVGACLSFEPTSFGHLQ